MAGWWRSRSAFVDPDERARAAASVSARHVRRVEASLAGFARETQLDHAGLRVDLVTVEPGTEAADLAVDQDPGRGRLVSRGPSGLSG